MRLLFSISMLLFLSAEVHAQCNRTLTPMTPQPVYSGPANDNYSVSQRSARHYSFYTLGQKPDSVYSYLDIITPYVFNGISWAKLPEITCKGWAHPFQQGNNWLAAGSFVRYVNGIKAPAGKYLGPLILNGGKWDTLPGTTVDSNNIIPRYCATDHHMFKIVSTGFKSPYYHLYHYDTAINSFQFLLQIKSRDFPDFHTTADRLIFSNIDSIGTKKNSSVSFIDAGLNLRVLSLGLTFTVTPVVGVEHKSNRIYMYNNGNNPTIYEIDTTVINTRKTSTGNYVIYPYSSFRQAVISNGTIMWEMRYTGTPEKRGFYVLCPQDSVWSFFEVSTTWNVAPHILNMVAGTDHGFFAIETTFGKIVSLDFAHRVSGRVWGDLDSNCSAGGSDVPLKSGQIGVHGLDVGAVSSTDDSGHYEMMLPKGTFAYNRHKLPYAPCFKDTITVSSDTQQHVYLLVRPKTDLELMDLNRFTWRWNTQGIFRFRGYNYGRYCDSGLFRISLDSGIRSVSNAHQTYDSATHSVWIKVKNIRPLDYRDFSVILIHDTARIKPDSNIRLHATYYAACGDMDSANNETTLWLRVVYSFDPNFKEVSEQQIKPGEVKRLDYYIGFQNEGSDYAEDVVLKDTLSQWLNLESLQVMGASFPYQMKLEGRVLTVAFRGIHLLPKKQSDSLSKGFFKYSIINNPNLKAGTRILNRAGIYFDLNKPILTNTAVTEVEWPVSVLRAPVRHAGLVLYPNPAGDYLVIRQSPASLATSALLLSATGQLIKAFDMSGEREYRLDIRDLPDGIYLLKSGAESAVFIKR